MKCEYADGDQLAAIYLWASKDELGMCACELFDLIESGEISGNDVVQIATYFKDLAGAMVKLAIITQLKKFEQMDWQDEIVETMTKRSDDFWREVLGEGSAEST